MSKTEYALKSKRRAVSRLTRRRPKPQSHYRSGPRGTTVRTNRGKGQYRGPLVLPKRKTPRIPMAIGKALGASTRQVVRKAPRGPRSFPTRTGRVAGRAIRSRKPSRPTRSFPTRSGPRPMKA